MTRVSQDDPVICLCFDVRRSQILAHQAAPGATYESLIDETKIGTKCTACRLDLEMLLGDTLNYGTPAPRAKPGATGYSISGDQLNCGFYLARDGITTTVRIANPSLPAADAGLTVDHRWQFKLFDADGRRWHRASGDLRRGGAVTLDLGEIPDCPEFGWFTLNLAPAAKGLVGNIRPQVLLSGESWTAAYHAQLASMASNRRSVMVTMFGGCLATRVPIINPWSDPTDLAIEIWGVDTSYRAKRNIAIARYSARLLDLDDLFEAPTENGTLVAALSSGLPLRHYIVNDHADGSISLDHFPNTR